MGRPKKVPATARKDYKLYESNDVAKYGIFAVTGNILSPIEYKALMYLLWKCSVETPGQFDALTMSLTELCHALGYENDKNYNLAHQAKQITDALLGIMQKPLHIRNHEKSAIANFVWLQTVISDYKTDTLMVRFNSDLGKWFGQSLKRDFTIVRLKYLNRLRSTAAVVLYPFFCRYRGMRAFNYDLDDLSMLLTGKHGCEYKHLKANYLKPAIDAINEHTDIRVDMEENKKGRKVISICFYVQSEPAFDELKEYMKHNELSMDEAVSFPYDDSWMDHYDYDMAKQQYIKKPLLLGPIND